MFKEERDKKPLYQLAKEELISLLVQLARVFLLLTLLSITTIFLNIEITEGLITATFLIFLSYIILQGELDIFKHLSRLIRLGIMLILDKILTKLPITYFLITIGSLTSKKSKDSQIMQSENKEED